MFSITILNFLTTFINILKSDLYKFKHKIQGVPKKIAEILRKKNLKQRFLGHPVDIPKPLKIVPHI